MKLPKNALTGVVALFSTFGAMAATAVNDPNAVLLGFRSTSDATIATAGKFLFVGLNGTSTQTFDFSTALNSTFGTNWFNSGEIRWGVYGVTVDESQDAGNSYINYGKTVVGSVNNSGIVLADGDWNGVISAAGVLDGIKINLASAGLTDTAGGYSYGTLSGGDYTSALGLASAFQSLLGGRSISYPGEFDLSSVTSLDINFFAPNLSDAPASFDTFSIPGVVSVASNGQVTVVPEPSTYALFALGALIVLGAMRRSHKA